MDATVSLNVYFGRWFDCLGQVALHSVRRVFDSVARLPRPLDCHSDGFATLDLYVVRLGALLPPAGPDVSLARAMANSRERATVLEGFRNREAQRQHARDSLLPLPCRSAA